MNKFKNLIIQLRSLTWQIWVVILLAFIIGVFMPNIAGSAPQDQTSHDSNEATTWTCSMHPQVKLPEAGQCPICFMDLIPLETGSSEISPDQLQLSEAAIALADISTTVITRGEAEREVRLSGKLAYDETRVKRISAWMPGRLDRLFVDYTGTSVRKGEHLFEIYSPELLAAQEELIQARDQLKRIGTGDAISKRTFEATLLAAREKLTLLGLSKDQISSIEIKGSASKTLTVHSPISGIVLSKSALEGTYVKTGSPVYTIADLTQLWLILDAYESDLSWLNYGQEIQFEAEANPGQVYTGLISFIDPILDESSRTVRIRANVPNPDGLLKPGMFVRATVKSNLDEGGELISNELAGKWVGPMHPEIIRSEPGDCDICGMPLVTAETLGYVKGNREERQPLLIPVSAVLLTGPRAVVYVQVPGYDEPTFELREVILGPRATDHYVVLEGLSEGERVVTHGSFKIDSAMQIAAKPSMMNPQGGASSTGHEHHGGIAPRESEERKIEPVAVSSDILQLLSPVYTSYFDIQEALARDDYRATIKSARRLSASISEIKIEGETNTGDGWKAIKDQLEMQLMHLDHWQGIESARKAFEEISKSILKLQRQFGHSGELTSYEVYCPMAFDNQGAAWLQSSKTVNNPYFGASMLRCGEVREQFTARTE